MSSTPIYDELHELRTMARRNGAMQQKALILRWIQEQLDTGKITRGTGVNKIIEGIEGITWEDTSTKEETTKVNVGCCGGGGGCTCKTSGTPSKSRRSSVGVSKSSKAVKNG